MRKTLTDAPQRTPSATKIWTVNVFTAGDSRDLSVWSNIPFLLCRTLEKRGCRVNRIAYPRDEGWLRRGLLAADWLWRHLRCDEKGRLYAKLYYALVDRAVRRASRKYPADLDITPFNCGNAFSPQPTLLLGDWTQEYLYRMRLGRQPAGYQKYYAARQDEVIERSDCVVSLFARCAADMRGRYRNPQIFHLGRNVVNDVCDSAFDLEAILRGKSASERILFVGKRHYAAAARQLVRVVARLRETRPGLTLDIVGLSRDELGISSCEGVVFHGYLNKSIPSQRAAYYGLLKGAKAFVNTTPLWGGYSSTVEAMYYGCPVVIAPYADFTEEFGAEIPFGAYCADTDDERLCALLGGLFDDPARYDRMCREAHRAVQDYTWDRYVDALLRLAEGLPERRASLSREIGHDA